MKIIVKTFAGLEPVLQAEMNKLGFRDIEILKRAVLFHGNKEDLYKANYLLRTAIRVLVPIFEFKARNDHQLYRNIKNFDWSEYLDNNQTLAVDSSVSSRLFRHSKYVALKTKDAIVDQFREKTGFRPSIDLNFPHLRVNVHIFREHVTVSLDSSNQSLHKRGYRLPEHYAPLNEVLAAGLIQISGWNRNLPLLDPMCGTGTILMEAAMLGNNVPPGYLRKEYGFQKWKNFDKEIWQSVLANSQKNIQRDPLPIFGADRAFKAISIAEITAKKYSFSRFIRFKQQEFETYQINSSEGMIIMNPPYDLRLKIEEIEEFYAMIGDKLKSQYRGWTAWILSGNLDAIKKIGLRSSVKKTLHNGAIQCKFLKYEMYSGSLKSKHLRPKEESK